MSDGDTLTARCVTAAGTENLKVRLAEIDAPEKRQAFGSRSRQHLAALCFRKQAEVRPAASDRYRRIVARVHCEGTDANAEQVRAGMAWAFTRYPQVPGVLVREGNERFLPADPLAEQAHPPRHVVVQFSPPHASPPWLP
jgi:endonuclease YncB( thermonuclease family)